MSTPLIISTTVQKRIAEIKAYAEAHRLDYAALKAHAATGEAFEDFEHRAMIIPINFGLVYSIEQQPPPLDWCHHFSFSTGAPGRVVHPEAVKLLLDEFDVEFPGWDKCEHFFEEGQRRALNVIIPFASITA